MFEEGTYQLLLFDESASGPILFFGCSKNYHEISLKHTIIIIRFPKNEHKGMEHPAETRMLGTVSTLTVTGFIVTPRTLGARVRLTEQQLAVYHQHDTEVALPLPQQQTQHSRNNNSSNSSNNKRSAAGSDRAKPNLASCRASLIRSETVSTGSCLLVR